MLAKAADHCVDMFDADVLRNNLKLARQNDLLPTDFRWLLAYARR